VKCRLDKDFPKKGNYNAPVSQVRCIPKDTGNSKRAIE